MKLLDLYTINNILDFWETPNVIPLEPSLDKDPLSYVVTVHFNNWRSGGLKPREFFEGKHKSKIMATHYFNLITKYGKKDIDRALKALYGVSIQEER